MDFSWYNITINPVGRSGHKADEYTWQVHEHLLWILRTKSGQILLNSIKFHGRPVEIQPYTGGDCNAAGGGRVVGGAIQGFVRYSPDTFSLHGACPANTSKFNRGLLWDEILFHELFHAFRNVAGKWSQRPLSGGLLRYTDTEEFLAVLVTNIYISDRTNRIKTGLRRDHRGFQSLEPEFAGPFGIFSSSTQTFGLVKQFCLDNPGLTKRLAEDLADTAFNPLRDYYIFPDLAERLSQNAGERDVAGALRDLGEILGILKKD